MGKHINHPDEPRMRAMAAVRACVLASLDTSMPHPLQFAEDEVPEEAEPLTMAAVALTALCMVVQGVGLTADNVQRIFDDILAEEMRR